MQQGYFLFCGQLGGRLQGAVVAVIRRAILDHFAEGEIVIAAVGSAQLGVVGGEPAFGGFGADEIIYGELRATEYILGRRAHIHIFNLQVFIYSSLAFLTV